MRQIVLPLALLLMTACNSSKEQPKPMEQATDTTTTMAEKVDTMQVDAITSATAIANPASFNGTLVIPPRNFATVSLSMDGIVKNLSLLPGTYIPKGAVLATLENPQFIELQQNYLDSHAQLEYLEAEYNRQTALSREEAASQKKYQQSKADYLSMKSRMQANAAQLRLLGIEPETLLKSGIRFYLEVTAPIGGYISNVQANLGKHLSAGEPLCDIIDKSETMVRLIAYEKDLNGMKVGSRVQFRVNGLGKQTFHATLISIGQQVDDTNRSIELYAKVLDGSPIFRPGMYVSARMEKE
ncbi:MULTISPECIES: efflux RND transporter periplasmic adaptor subunit [unclassified Bacteroides]|jgi:cobalt-zinc-cadmium efflux system membrane fusion protein|uniref:efflux RND transporter periplasmic adaptor subunit n=1 Tax=unclassified Bacteroides TaxID=2646097 RepID=UPI000E8BAAE9|nr:MULTISPECIES: efflux RND transporter periplasmic adaptor subunit [unclassified Bacteroides]RGN47664.1 efflux RND transporter periplasmic adaptor subunit [Bacteroides sp. OM05-12]RHR75316.1 efflux RND transporter periplasmic adaptor subunit [Bacteroides sp. AF16-49]